MNGLSLQPQPNEQQALYVACEDQEPANNDNDEVNHNHDAKHHHDHDED